MHARLIAINSGDIKLNQVDPGLSLTPRQRARARYEHNGKITWPGNPPLTAPGHWTDMVLNEEDDSDAVLSGDKRLLVVRLMLHHDQPGFRPEAQAWDIADPNQHLAGLAVRPAGGLLASLAAIHSLVQSVPSTPAMPDPLGRSVAA